MPRILGFVFDDENDAKFAVHGIRSDQVEQVLDSEHLVIKNRRARRGLYLVIGRDWGGSCLAIPVEPTHDPGLWRPITAWKCKASEDSALHRHT